VSCLRMLLDRLWPPRKGQPVDAIMPPIKTSQDLSPPLRQSGQRSARVALPLMKQALCLLLSTARFKQSSFMTLQSASQL
jgi:hypothetical protein